MAAHVFRRPSVQGVIHDFENSKQVLAVPDVGSAVPALMRPEDQKKS